MRSPLLDNTNLLIVNKNRIWLVDLALKVAPDTQLDAFDITTDLIPHAKWRPENVDFHKLDIFQPVPDEFKGKYDVVHIRFFSPVIGRTGPEPAIKAALDMLSTCRYPGCVSWRWKS